MSPDAPDPAARSSERLPRTSRLRQRADFLRVQRNGRRVHTRHFVVVLLPRSEPDAGGRIGITVTKKVAGAVGRNHAKRVLREVYRRGRTIFPPHCDIVIIAKSGADVLRYDEVRSELSRVERAMATAADKARASSGVMEAAR